MTLEPSKGYRALRHGRHSGDGNEYFITFCTEQRLHGLTDDVIGKAVFAEMHAMETEGVWSLRCTVIMPDHIHMLFQLGDKLPLGKAVARLKSKSSASLQRRNLRWQKGYFEHTMRPREDRLPLFLYVYLNPYKARLISTGDVWPWFECGKEDTVWFTAFVHEGLPEPQWVINLP
jgi:REP element-mobilizing transposase RayT